MFHVRSGCLKFAVAAAGIILWAAVAVAPAVAAPVSFNFSGVALGGDLALYTALGLGTDPTVSGTVTYNPLLVGPSNGSYFGAITGLNIAIAPGSLNSFTATLGNAGLNAITISDTLSPSYDQYQMIAPITFLAPPNSATHAGPYFPLDFQLNFVHAPGVFTGNNGVPSLGSLLSADFRLGFQTINGNPQITGPVGSITAVPLPPAVLLFGAGIAALVGLGARSRQQKAKEVA